MLISYLTWIMAFTGLTAISVGCKSIATCFIHCTFKHRTFNCVTDTGIYTDTYICTHNYRHHNHLFLVHHLSNKMLSWCTEATQHSAMYNF